MVDAVSAINAKINTIIQQRKDVSINWKDMTAQEVLEQANKGQDIPLDVLKWAEDYAKLQNVPDDVTYDSVNGEKQRDEVIQEAADSNSISAGDIKEEAAEESDEVEDTTTETENKEDTKSPDELYQEGALLQQESAAATNNVNTAITEAQQQAETSQKIAEESQNTAEQTITQTKSQKSQYDNLVNKITSDKSNIQVSDLNKLQNLSKLLNINGNRAQTRINIYDYQIQAIEAEFAQYQTLSEETIVTGDSTIDTGNELLKLVPPDEEFETSALIDNFNKDNFEIGFMNNNKQFNYRFLFNKYYTMGKADITDGGTAGMTGQEGIETVNSSTEINNESKAEITDSRQKVEDATMVEGQNIDVINNNEENQKEVDSKAKEEKLNKNSTGSKTDLNGVKDSTLLSDNLELQRRREMRGEQPPKS